MTRVLLVTGARSLADSRDAERWARALIAEALAGTDLLIVGDADGPDAWAWDETLWLMSPTLSVRCYRTHGADAGWITEAGRGEWWRIGWWALKGDAHPLRRNAAMVSDAEEMAAHKHAVSVLAMLDGRKPAKPAPGEQRPTRGTEHTVGLARKSGLSVREERWAP